jgi:DnaJ-class molecular chaperone
MYITDKIPQNLYNILNLSTSASQADIKQSFRYLSLQYHPDKNKDKRYKEKYDNIKLAYEILSNIDKKNVYDLQLNNINKNVETNSLLEDKYMIIEQNNKLDNINNINNINNVNNIYNIPEPIFKIIEITLLQAYIGCILPIYIEKKIEYNKNISKELENIYVTIPKGIDNNEIIIIKNKGNSINHIIGDIKIQIKIKIHDTFIRNGLDLIYKKTITLKESLCGFNFEIKHINDKLYIIKNNGENIIKDNEEKIIYKLGIIRENYIGNLVIIFNIIYPIKLSLEQKKKLELIL